MKSEFISTGYYVPERVLHNDDLKQWWDTSDEWITERTGIKQRYWVEPGKQAGSDLALEATKLALERADMQDLSEGQKVSFDIETDSRSGKLAVGTIAAA